MCNTHDKHAHQAHPPRPAPRSARLNPAHPTSRHARRARERKPYATPQNHRRAADPRNRTDLDAECDRSRHGLRPISMRSATDLGTGYDRSRCGVRPISTRNSTDLDAESDRPASGPRSLRLSPAGPTSRRARRARGRKPHAAPRNHQHTADLRNRTDLGTGFDRSRAGTGPISAKGRVRPLAH